MFVDGIRIARNAVVLIASTDEHVIGWYLAKSENSRAWAALMSPIPPPDVVVTDGGTGFEKARKKAWPETRVQRCVFHAFNQVKKQTTTRPKLQAGVELYGLRNGLDTLIRRGHLFTFLDPELTAEGPVPGTNNRLEGGVNAPLREMLRPHRGMSTLRRAKAVFWRCCMHSECPLPPAEILQVMPTDGDIAELYRKSAYAPPETRGTPGMGRWPGVVRAAPFKTLANRLGLVIHQHVLAYSPGFLSTL